MSNPAPTSGNDRAGAPRAPARARGRPRSEDAHRAILAATLTLLDELGYAGLTIEAVAARAGVGKSTIYRRWSSKVDLVAAALHEIGPHVPPADTGSLPGDLAAFRQRQVENVAGGPLPRVAPQLLAEAITDDELHDAVIREGIAPVRSALRHMFTRAVERGELPENLDVELAVDLVHGTVIYRLMLTRGDLVEASAHLPQLLALLSRQ